MRVRLTFRSAAAWLAVIVVPGIGGAADAPPASRAALARGEHVARAVCSACHVVAADQEFPPLLDPAPPSFAEIAARPATTAASVRKFVLGTHWDMKSLPLRMPDLSVRPADASAVANYIVSLRKG